MDNHIDVFADEQMNDVMRMLKKQDKPKKHPMPKNHRRRLILRIPFLLIMMI